MESDSEAAEALPTRRRRARARGRHRGAQSLVFPPDAPPLVIAVPGAASGTAGVAAETVSLIEALQTGADVRVGHLEGSDGDPAALGAVLDGLATGDRDSMAGGLRAVVVPLIAGPHASIDAAVRRVVSAAAVPAAIAEPLGPHPLLAEVLHVRLAGAGLARADRIRLVGITTAADGIALAAVGGEEAARATEATAVLLAARLAVPVVAAVLDGSPDVAAATTWLRQAGATRLAVAPCIFGPETDAGSVAASAAEIGAECAEPLGAHPVIAQLIIERYTDVLEAVSVQDARNE